MHGRRLIEAAHNIRPLLVLIEHLVDRNEAVEALIAAHPNASRKISR
jgi:enoyl reductase-like protein